MPEEFIAYLKSRGCVVKLYENHLCIGKEVNGAFYGYMWTSSLEELSQTPLCLLVAEAEEYIQSIGGFMRSKTHD